MASLRNVPTHPGTVEHHTQPGRRPATVNLQVEVRWPSGRVDRFAHLEIDRLPLERGRRNTNPIAKSQPPLTIARSAALEVAMFGVRDGGGSAGGLNPGLGPGRGCFLRTAASGE